MTSYTATVQWKRPSRAVFTDGRYSRAHVWRFDGGAEVLASSSPHVVPIPLSAAEYIDPEEAFVASLASCHMLFFLSRAAKRGFVVDGYEDAAEGTMAKNADGRMAMVRVVLNPRILYAGAAPDHTTEEAMHHEAHERCFIANSVKTAVETRIDRADRHSTGNAS
jgi:organic hydroperoxide reductase OsmC/OhrA